ncbi:cobalamin-independent methionine synthase II family protein [Paenibacillus sp. TRM 82003]|uniref:cobalamin-independent methionine synthase II family protein n=1 Tax=Kineococcus sp. TRM81007 TaxID=2925831 RepID=UPI001F5A06E2|nr:cobalamin-independent methionine synthase II family protein [Kineococcus sp. TRM81007]MCI2240142.1 cobalamin-independent methionine synthase II family protein [Kineococcus sp. TRM81007]MCI3925551.1 cobalamin-independent methionine synthase II family protein [Paenibacillus sp. TRM 82003]
MSRNARRIEVSHAGSLPRTPELIAANDARELAEDGLTLQRTPEFDELLTGAVVDLVRRQRDLGITLVGDGEYGKAMSSAVDYGAWWSYSFQRVAGLEVTEENIFNQPTVRSEPGNVRLTSFTDRRDRQLFAEAYADPESGVSTGRIATAFPATTGPLSYTGQDAIASDVANLVAGLDAAGLDRSQGFITSLSPGSGARISDRYYATEEEHIWAWAEVMREEYRAVVDAGLVLQIDDPSIAENWDQINPEPSVEDYRAFTRIRVEALNHAIRDLPAEQVRFHLCWGSWHGPHTTDIEFRHIADLMLEINAGSYSFEAANARHEHEWKIWKDLELPAGKKIVPGVVGHATNVVEHPELVADRIERFASVVGAENVVAATDCGLGGRIHPQIAVAKLAALGEGAAIASRRLFG